ncbi:MAG: hypothetical protein J0H54_04375 [Rhizobiales bacterium]|nr:hypothetical protein [Hyphomicrobiales bacterium]
MSTATAPAHRWIARPHGFPATLAGLLALLLLWELGTRTLLAGFYVLAAPSAILGRIVENRDL